jgi:Gylcosyl hydrolase family 115 C-terminal domain/Glycosyl hydrolase family 115
MAYNAKKWNVSNQNQFLKSWARREFGTEHSDEIAAIMDKYYRLGFARKPEHLQWFLPKEAPHKSDLTEAEALQRLKDYEALENRAVNLSTEFFAFMPTTKMNAFYELVLYPVRSAANANERFFAAEIAEEHRKKNLSDAVVWAKRSIAANAEIMEETDYFNNKLANGKWRGMMSPEMNEGQWTSMRSVPPKINLKDFENTNSADLPKKETSEIKGNSNIISIEAENFKRRNARGGFLWEIIEALGKTGDSVTVFPNIAKTFSGDAPSLEYRFYASNSLEYFVNFFLIPTQPLIPNNELRFAFSVDNGEPQIISIDKDREVSSPKWASNILNQTTIGKAKIKLTKGTHILKIFAVDTGVVLDKIVLSQGELPTSYFAPNETLVK